VCRLRDEADVIVTNPPFSLFREFLAWILEGNKKQTDLLRPNGLRDSESVSRVSGEQIRVLKQKRFFSTFQNPSLLTIPRNCTIRD
jgi:hypothetical protein